MQDLEMKCLRRIKSMRDGIGKRKEELEVKPIIEYSEEIRSTHRKNELEHTCKIHGTL